MRWFRAVASVVCGLTLTLSLPAVADAGYWYGSDPDGDVTQTTHDPDPEPCGTDTVTPLPDDTTHDITRLRLDHRVARVVVTVRLRDLVTEGRNFTAITLRTDGRTYWLDALRFATGRVEFFLTPKPKHLPPPDECGHISVLVTDSPCGHFAGQWDADADLVRLSVPRVCIGDPGWVSASAASYAFRGQDIFLDDRWQPTEGSGYYTPRVMSE